MKNYATKLIVIILTYGVLSIANATEYLCTAFDNDTTSEYQWKISITPVAENIYVLQGRALDNSWRYAGRGFKQNKDLYFYWKLGSGESGLVHYRIDPTTQNLKGDWISDSATEILAESCEIN